MQNLLKRLYRTALVCLGCIVLPVLALEPPIARDALKSGAEFVSVEIRAMQQDDFANPGMLWVACGMPMNVTVDALNAREFERARTAWRSRLPACAADQI